MRHPNFLSFQSVKNFGSRQNSNHNHYTAKNRSQFFPAENLWSQTRSNQSSFHANIQNFSRVLEVSFFVIVVNERFWKIFDGCDWLIVGYDSEWCNNSMEGVLVHYVFQVDHLGIIGVSQQVVWVVNWQTLFFTRHFVDWFSKLQYRTFLKI